MSNFPLKVFCIKVVQPFGEFFVTSLSAKDLLKLSFSDPIRYNEAGTLDGIQRGLQDKRVNAISQYINGVDAAFPNSIILSANYLPDGSINSDEETRWKISPYNEPANLYELEIPSEEKMASLVDGQHRVRGFEGVSESRQKEIQLLVAIYFDLPNPYQAFIFATINYNQKPVDKSLAYEQWGYSIENSAAITWSPEMLSVFLTRKLNLDRSSSFYNHIIVAPQNDHLLFSQKPKENDWYISTATVVEGILRLISTNPQRDLNKLRLEKVENRKRSILPLEDSNKTPLRQFYLESNDILIYTIINNFFQSADEIFIKAAFGKNSFIKKTVGVQALFDVLKEILARELINKKISVDYFTQKLIPSKFIDFSDNYFQASGTGRSRIRNIILYSLGYLKEAEVKEKDVVEFKRLIK